MGLISPTWVFATIYKRVKWMVHGRNLHFNDSRWSEDTNVLFQNPEIIFVIFLRILSFDFFLKVYYLSSKQEVYNLSLQLLLQF